MLGNKTANQNEGEILSIPFIFGFDFWKFHAKGWKLHWMMIEWEKFWYKKLYWWNIIIISPFNPPFVKNWVNKPDVFVPSKGPVSAPRWHLPLKPGALSRFSTGGDFTGGLRDTLSYGRLVYIYKNWKSFTNSNPKVPPFLRTLAAKRAPFQPCILWVREVIPESFNLKNRASWPSIGKNML